MKLTNKETKLIIGSSILGALTSEILRSFLPTLKTALEPFDFYKASMTIVSIGVFIFASYVYTFFIVDKVIK